MIITIKVRWKYLRTSLKESKKVIDRQSACHEIHPVLAVDQRERKRHRQAESKRPPVLMEIPVLGGGNDGGRQ
jgi:hypothetical protein